MCHSSKLECACWKMCVGSSRVTNNGGEQSSSLDKMMEQKLYRAQVPRGFVALSILFFTLFSFTSGIATYQFLAQQPAFPSSEPASIRGEPDNQFTILIPSKQTDGSCNAQNDEDEEDEDDDGIPLAQHLLVDVQNVEEAFLSDENRLAKAMIEFSKAVDFEILSYKCHKAQGSISCAGGSQESHISLVAWAESGVVLLDFFTSGTEALLYAPPLVEEYFAVGNGRNGKRPTVFWWLKNRGFGDDDSEHDIIKNVDFFNFPVGQKIDYKKQRAYASSPFQEIFVFDVLTPALGSVEAYEKSLSNDGSYESQHPELFAPDRIVFLDGVLQSRRTGDAAYHEALVHPTMFAHPNPKRVAIIGGGEGATLREVLKHETVEKVVMIDIDQIMVEASMEHLPEWSDCSNLVGRADSCFDDERAEVYFDDAFAWFKNRFLDTANITEELFDVVIMDALDPQGLLEIVGALYTDKNFYTSLYQSLNKGGILIAQVGEASRSDDAPEELSWDMYRAELIRGLVNVGFEAVREYEEMNCGFMAPWAFMVAFKEEESESSWFHEEDLINLKMRQRLTPTVEGNCPLYYFDGSTMSTYWHPSRAREDMFCISSPKKAECAFDHGFEPKQEYLSIVHVACLRHHHNCSAVAKASDPAAEYWLLEDPRFKESAKQLAEKMKNHTSLIPDALTTTLQSGPILPPRSRRGGTFNPFMDRQVKLEVPVQWHSSTDL